MVTLAIWISGGAVVALAGLVALSAAQLAGRADTWSGTK